MATDDEKSLGVVLYRLDEIEGRRKEDRRHFDDIVGELKAEVRSSISAIAYVSKENFADFKVAAAERDKETREIATSARTLALTILWVLIVAFSGGVMALLFRLATA